MFENALIESHRQRPQRRRMLTLPLAVTIHATVLAGVMAVQLWAVEEVPEPEITVALVTTKDPVLLPPPPPPPRAQSAPQSHQADVKPVQDVQPSSVPATIPSPAAQEGRGGPGVEGAMGDGTEWSDELPLVNVPLPTPTPEPVPDNPLIVGGAVVAPTLLRRVEPVYPEVARMARRQGVVVVEAIVDKEGNVTEADASDDGVGFGCKEAAIEAIRQWRYAPATLHGHPVSVYLRITVEFKLQ